MKVNNMVCSIRLPMTSFFMKLQSSSSSSYPKRPLKIRYFIGDKFINKSVNFWISFNENLEAHCFESNIEQKSIKTNLDDSPHLSSGVVSERKYDKRTHCKSKRDTVNSSADIYSTSYANAPLKETFIRHKAKRSHVMVSKEVITKIKSTDIVGLHSATYEGLNANSLHESITSAQDGANSSNMETERCPHKKSHMLIK
nr:ubiquitin carboxyl-terminal hydrolase 15-like isoform X1 [Tanacetum cinerariifolium]